MSGIKRISTATSVTQSTPGIGTTATPAATNARRLTMRRQWRTTASISFRDAGTTTHSSASRRPGKNLLIPNGVTVFGSLLELRGRSGEALRPDLVEPLHAHGLRGLQLLREEADAQLFQPPAELVEAGVAGAAPLREFARMALLERANFRKAGRVASRIGAQ